MSQDFSQPSSFEQIKEKTEKYVLNTYNRIPIAFYFGQGEYIYDTDNNRYIDFMTGIAVNSLGHGEADLIQAIRDQSDRIIHTSNLFYNEEQANLAEVLIENSFPGKAFFCNSGTEANEAALKLAKSYGFKTGRKKILSLKGSFHGRTTGSMSLTGQEKIREGFGDLLSGIEYIEPNHIEMLEAALGENPDDISALFLEPVQGEIGVVPLTQEFVRKARSLTEEHGILLIFDEIQTGIGRTGKLFAFEHFGITPDVMTLAKALGNGFPIGAMIVANRFAEYLGPGQHGSTFGGNHLGARIAYETIRVILSRDLLTGVQKTADYIVHRLNQIKAKKSLIKEVRGLGLHIGVELDQPCADLVHACMKSGLLINCTNTNVVRLVPALNLSLEVAQEAMDILESQMSV